jgi:hypothetical protein
MAKRTTADLRVIPAQPQGHGVPPPAHLDEVGAALWHRVVADYVFDDPASYQILADACLCTQRAERCRKLIDAHGELLQTKYGPKPNPLIRDETQLRALTARLLEKLGLTFEAIRTPGRPPGIA